MIDGNLQLSDVLHQTSRNLDRKAVDCQRPRQKKEGSSDHQYDAVAEGTGRKTIEQLAGHEIHLEIEDVLDKKLHE